MPKQSITLRLGRRRNTLLVPSAQTALGRVGTPTVITPPVGGDLFRVGLMGMAGHVGEGPSRTNLNPWRAVQWNPFNEGTDASITTVINTAILKDIWLIAMVANNSADYGGGASGNRTFNFTSYKANVDRMYGIDAFRNNVRCAQNPNGIILLYAGDEPYLNATWSPQYPGNTSNSDNTHLPSVVNRNCRYIKDKTGGTGPVTSWAGCYTLYRCDPVRFADGWGAEINGVGGVVLNAADYDALDYSWVQYEANYLKGYHGQAKNLTFNQIMAFQKTYANNLQMGIACSVNFMNVGPRTGSIDGFNACWDYLDNNASSGTVCGPWTGWSGTGYSEGAKVLCASTGSTPVNGNFLTPPAYCALIASRAAADLTIPFLLYWTQPVGGPGESQLLITGGYWGRADYDTELRNAQINGNNDTRARPLRAAKLKPPGGWPP